MPSLIDIRRRIRSTKSTQQITKAMKMVSSSKLRRAQERIVNSRPYAHEMLRIFNNLATRVDPSTHPLLNDDPTPGRTLLVVITADRGLCGGFNANVIKSAAQFLAERQAGTASDQESYANREVALALVGRKGRDFFMRRGFDVRYEEVNIFNSLKWSHAQAIARTSIDEFLSPEVSNVYLIYNEFRSVISQRVVIERLLPIPKLEPDSAAINTVDYLFEPSPQELLSILLPVSRLGPGRAGAAGVVGGRARRADDGDGRRDPEREGHGGPADAVHEQGAAGLDHPRDHRDRRGRAVGIEVRGLACPPKPEWRRLEVLRKSL